MVPFPQHFGALQELWADYTKGFFFGIAMCSHLWAVWSGSLMMYSEMAERWNMAARKGNAMEQTLLEPVKLWHGSS